MNEGRYLEGSGVFDYDYVNDILFFKVNEREYSHSIELADYVVDIDSEDFVVGLQVFNASKHFNLLKSDLRLISNWKFNASIKDNVIEVKVVFNMNIRNRIVEKSPMIIQRTNENLQNSNMVATINC